MRDGLLLAGIVAFGAAGCGDGGDCAGRPDRPGGDYGIDRDLSRFGDVRRDLQGDLGRGVSRQLAAVSVRRAFLPRGRRHHVEELSFWSSGGIATGGIESMAETGAVTAFCNEVQAEVDGGRAGGCIRGQEASFRSPGTVTLAFDVDEGSPFLTLVSMIAPSPDWFVGVDGIALRQGGCWDAADRDGSRRLRRGDGQRHDVHRPRRRRHSARADRADRRPARDGAGSTLCDVGAGTGRRRVAVFPVPSRRAPSSGAARAACPCPAKSPPRCRRRSRPGSGRGAGRCRR